MPDPATSSPLQPDPGRRIGRPLARPAPGRPRWRARRGPVLVRRLASAGYWVVVAAVAMGTFAWVGAIVRGAEETKAQFGASVVVAVATRDLRPGDELVAGDVAARVLPAAAVSPGAVREGGEGGEGNPLGDGRDVVDRLAGRIVREAIVAGEVVVERRVAPLGVDRTGALAPVGSRTISIDLQRRPTPARPGDLADLVAVDPVDGRGVVVARAVVVVALTDDAVTVAMTAGDVEAAAAAIAGGTVVLAVHGGPERAAVDAAPSG